jgi:hypothetical protein
VLGAVDSCNIRMDQAAAELKGKPPAWKFWKRK